jgi:hypothetical protein
MAADTREERSAPKSAATSAASAPMATATQSCRRASSKYSSRGTTPITRQSMPDSGGNSDTIAR